MGVGGWEAISVVISGQNQQCDNECQCWSNSLIRRGSEETLRERQALPVLQGHLGASRMSCLCQSEDVENQRGIVGILWPAMAAAAPWERREAGSSRSADHKNLSVPSGSSLLSYHFFFFLSGVFCFHPG